MEKSVTEAILGVAFTWEVVHLNLMASWVVVPLAFEVVGPSAVMVADPVMDPDPVEAYLQEEARYLVSNLRVTVEGAPLASEVVVPSASEEVVPLAAREADP